MKKDKIKVKEIADFETIFTGTENDIDLFSVYAVINKSRTIEEVFRCHIKLEKLFSHAPIRWFEYDKIVWIGRSTTVPARRSIKDFLVWITSIDADLSTEHEILNSTLDEAEHIRKTQIEFVQFLCDHFPKCLTENEK